MCWLGNNLTQRRGGAKGFLEKGDWGRPIMVFAACRLVEKYSLTQSRGGAKGGWELVNPANRLGIFAAWRLCEKMISRRGAKGGGNC